MPPEEGKRVLLLMTTATYRASAYMAAAGEMGVRVTVGTDRPDLLAELNPGGSITLDYAQPEVGAGLIETFAREFPIDAIAPVDDDTLILGAMAAEALGLPYHPVEASRTTRSKYELRKVLSEEGLPSPSFRLVSAQEEPEKIAQGLRYPCVLKPTFLAASRGVIRANDETEFAEAYRRVGAILDDPETIARGGAEARMILVEDYLNGVEVAVEGLVVRGEVHILAIFDKPDPLEGPFFEETIYVTPSRLSDETQDKIREETTRAARAIRLREGPLHAELRINDAGEIRVIDVASRAIGGKCSGALEFGGGASLECLILSQALGVPPPSMEREKSASGVMMIPIPGAGVLRGVEGKEEAMAVPGVVEVDISIHVGGRVVPLPEGERYLGFIFAKGERPEEVEAALRAAHAKLRFDIGE